MKLVNKMGRPTTEPKTNQTRIRMSDDDLKLLEECADELNLSKSDVIRLGIKLVYETLGK